MVVYVRCGPLPAGIHGQLTFLAAAGGVRYLVVQIARDFDLSRTITILGHELPHALEIME